MLHKKLTPLEATKRLLVAESEINRKLLTVEYGQLTSHVHDTLEPVRQAVGSAVAVIEAIKSFRSHTGGSDGKRPWFFGTLLKTGLGLWQDFRANRR